MQRLFVAAPIPAPVKEALVKLGGGVMGARWQSAEQMHITLRFIGEVDEAMARDIAQALSKLTMPAFTVELDGVGLFGKMKDPRILWVGLRPRDKLVLLHEKVDRLLIDSNIAPDRRKFAAHITLARFGHRGRQRHAPKGLEMFLAAFDTISGHAFSIDEFILYRSHLGHEGAAYEALAHYPLTDAPAP